MSAIQWVDIPEQFLRDKAATAEGRVELREHLDRLRQIRAKADETIERVEGILADALRGLNA